MRCNSIHTIGMRCALDLVWLAKDGRVRAIELRQIDGVPAREHPSVGALSDAGFIDGYYGPTLRG